MTRIHETWPHDRSERVLDRIVVARVQLGDVSSCATDNWARIKAAGLTKRLWCPGAPERRATRHCESFKLYVHETVVSTIGIGL